MHSGIDIRVMKHPVSYVTTTGARTIMGYTTDFEGSLTITPELAPGDWARFHIMYNSYDHADLGRDQAGSPNSYCQWEVCDDTRDQLSWDGGEKFYNYTEWLQYLANEFFGPNGYTLNGEIVWSGEDVSDVGKLVVRNNVVFRHEGFPNPDSTPLTKQDITKLIEAVHLADGELEGAYAVIRAKLEAMIDAM